MSQPAPDQKVVRRKLADEILDRLLHLIEAGEVAPGGFLPSERDLMIRFGVGRPAVREALQALAAMGVIHIQHGERARLSALGPGAVLDRIDRTVRHLLQTSPETREHLSEARLMFESGMVRLAARRARAGDVQMLRQALDAQIAARESAAGFVAADIGFHTVIASLAGNPIYTALSRALLEWVFGLYPQMLRVPGTESLTIEEHETILARIAANDENGAVNAMDSHLRRSNPLYAAKTRRKQAGSPRSPDGTATARRPR